jgi:hemin uptake protein HemP
MNKTFALHQPQAAKACEQQAGERPAPVPSQQLLQGRRLLEIAHNGEVYRLQATRLGKLILTK